MSCGWHIIMVPAICAKFKVLTPSLVLPPIIWLQPLWPLARPSASSRVTSRCSGALHTTCLPFNSFSFHCVPVSLGAGLAGEVAPGAAAAASLRTGVCAQPAVMATMATRGISLASVNMAFPSSNEWRQRSRLAPRQRARLTNSRLFFLFQARVEQGARRRHIDVAGLRIDKGIAAGRGARFLPLPQLRGFRMRRNEDVAGQLFQCLEAVAQICHRVRIFAAGAELEAGPRDGVEAIRVDHVQAAGAVARLPRPAQASGR